MLETTRSLSLTVSGTKVSYQRCLGLGALLMMTCRSVCLSSLHLWSLEGTYRSVRAPLSLLTEVRACQVPETWLLQEAPEPNLPREPPGKLLLGPSFFACFSRQPRGSLPEGPENDRDYRARFIQMVNFSHSGYKVN